MECCKCVVNGKNELTLYLDANDYLKATTLKDVFNLEPILDYGFDE